MSITAKAIAQAIVITAVTCRSFASRGGADRWSGLSRSMLACGFPVT